MHPVLFHIGSIMIPSYGAATAVGMLLALYMADGTAHIAGLDGGKVWKLCVGSAFAAMMTSRLLLAALNWSALRHFPLLILALSIAHHPIVGAFSALAGVVCVVVYGRWLQLPFWSTTDVLASPAALALAFEQLGALLAGSGYGTRTTAHWTVTYTSPLAALWSGAPLGVALDPVQAYAALGFLALSMLLLLWLPHRRQRGDVAGLLLLGAGVIIFFTEFWRDSTGWGARLGGAFDELQALAILLVVAGGLVLLERKRPMEG
jgi:phosphatidylglycerol:prolipoprotein diacylglycerol transferase